MNNPTLRTYTYKGLTVYYKEKNGIIDLHDIEDEDENFVSINLKEQQEIKRRINEASR